MKKIFLIMAVLLLVFSGCSKDDKPTGPGDVTAKYDPFAQDDEDKSSDPKAVEQSAAVRGGCQTFRLDRIENGNRRTAKIRKPLWNEMSYASVRFSDGFYVSRVNMRKANRINSGKGNGFVSRRGESYVGVYAVAPYSRRPTHVTYCPVR